MQKYTFKITFEAADDEQAIKDMMALMDIRKQLDSENLRHLGRTLRTFKGLFSLAKRTGMLSTRPDCFY